MTFLSKEKLTEELNKHPMVAQHLDCMDVFDSINESVVDDVMQIVRCKDCKWEKWMDADNEVVFCKRQNTSHDWNWFCADGFAKDINVPGKKG